MNSFVEYLPSDLVLVFNELDEARVVPRDAGTPPVEREEYTSIDDVFGHNKCFRTHNLAHRYSFGQFIALSNSLEISSAEAVIFSQSKQACFSDILMPMTIHFHNSANSKQQQQHHGLPWSRRTDSVVWRGSSTGGYWRDGGLYWRGQRQRLVEAVAALKTNHSLTSRLGLDVGFTRMLQCEKGACKRLQERYPLLKTLTSDQIFSHKYLLDVDGNGWTSRLVSLLASGSLVIKAKYSLEYLDSVVLPGEHYEALDVDYATLGEVLGWVLDHDDEVQRVVQRAAALARERLRAEDMQCYVARLVLEYASLVVSLDPRHQ